MQSEPTNSRAPRSFWEASWERLEPERLAAYVDGFDLGADETVARLRREGVQRVCDAGCGCGIYALKLAANGFSVSGFDVSARAVALAQALFDRSAYSAVLQTASILDTGYADGAFDCVLSRDVLDHLPRAEAVRALRELCRITRPGGLVLFTLDPLDEEYRTEPHVLSAGGDYLYTGGKWDGMVFHPYTRQEALRLVPGGMSCEITERDGALTVLLRKA